MTRKLLKSDIWFDGDQFRVQEILYEEGGDVYFLQDPCSQVKINQNQLQTAVPGEKVEKKFYFPLLSDCEGKTRASIDVLPHAFVKTPFLPGIMFRKVTDHTSSDAFKTRDLYAHEMEILEKLIENPHPNICQYYGYTADDFFVTGLCFEKHTSSLWDAVQQGKQLDADFILQEIRNGVSHLHSLHLSHNDLSPINVMLDFSPQGKVRKVVIIDFDSATMMGENLPKQTWKGSGWVDHTKTQGSEDNDWFAWGIIKKFLAARPIIQGSKPTDEELTILSRFSFHWCQGLSEGYEEYRDKFYSQKN